MCTEGDEQPTPNLDAEKEGFSEEKMRKEQEEAAADGVGDDDDLISNVNEEDYIRDYNFKLLSRLGLLRARKKVIPTGFKKHIISNYWNQTL